MSSSKTSIGISAMIGIAFVVFVVAPFTTHAMPQTIPGHLNTIEEIEAYIAGWIPPTAPQLGLKREPKLVNVAADGVIDETEKQSKSFILSVPKFTQTLKNKHVRYALTKEESCDRSTNKGIQYKKDRIRARDIQEDGIYYICSKAKKGEHEWQSRPIQVVRNTAVLSHATVGTRPVNCSEGITYTEGGLVKGLNAVTSEVTTKTGGEVIQGVDSAVVGVVQEGDSIGRVSIHKEYVCIKFKKEWYDDDRNLQGVATGYELYEFIFNNGSLTDAQMINSWKKDHTWL